MNSRTATEHAADVPGLDPGLTLLSGDPAALHRLVAAELARGRTETLWVDPGMAVSTYALYDLVPSERALSGLQVARAFTAYQHHSLVRALPRRASARTDLVVLPGIADLYRDEDVPDYEREALFSAALAVCGGLADSLSVPVLVSDAGGDDLSALAVERADETVDAEHTDQGLAFRGGGFETLGYWGRDYWQTTIPYWVELFGAVDPEASLAAADPDFGVGSPAEPVVGPVPGLATPSLEG